MGSLSAAPSSSVIPTLFAILRGFDLDFEITAWLPLFLVVTTPFNVLVVVPDEIIASVVLLVAAGETRGMRPVSLPLWLVLGGWERALITDPGVTWVHEQVSSFKESNVPIGVPNGW